MSDKAYTIKELLTRMFTGFALREASWEMVNHAHGQYTRSEDDAMAEAFDGDKLLGSLFVLFGHWSNDIEQIAAHYGVGMCKVTEDGRQLHSCKVDTLLTPGKLTVIEIPPAPSLAHYWYEGRWNEPEIAMFNDEVK